MATSNKSNRAKVQASSGNVFRDLGLPRPETHLAKAELVRRIAAILEERDLTQVQAAEILGVDQPKVSNLLNGQLSGFSTDRILRFLTALDQDVEIRVKPKPRSRRQARVKVVAA